MLIRMEVICRQDADIHQELVAILSPFRILSSKILRDSMGNSRGVGFARYVFSPGYPSHFVHILMS